MARPALTEEQRREIRRRIREAAAALYATEGLAEISARAIAKEAGVSVGTIYSHFANLAELMQSLWRQPVRQLVRDLAETAAGEGTALQRLRRLMQIYVDFAFTERAVYRGAFLFVRPDAHDKPETVPINQAGIAAPFIQVIREAQGEGSVRGGDAVALAQMVWAGLHGALALPQNVDRVAYQAPETMASDMADLLMAWLTEEG